jgi:hypothetical protein
MVFSVPKNNCLFCKSLFDILHFHASLRASRGVQLGLQEHGARSADLGTAYLGLFPSHNTNQSY